MVTPLCCTQVGFLVSIVVNTDLLLELDSNQHRPDSESGRLPLPHLALNQKNFPVWVVRVVLLVNPHMQQSLLAQFKHPVLSLAGKGLCPSAEK